MPPSQAVASRRTGNHRRQQRLRPGRHDEFFNPRRLVDRRRHFRILVARRESGGSAPPCSRRSRRLSVAALGNHCHLTVRRQPHHTISSRRFPSAASLLFGGFDRKICVTPLRRANSTSASAGLSLSRILVSIRNFLAKSKCRSSCSAFGVGVTATAKQSALR